MARPRAELSVILHTLCDNVYFQPPEVLTYPCIVYKRVGKQLLHADNETYLVRNEYTVTVIDRDPDSAISENVSKLTYCNLDTTFQKDNLNHDVYKLYF